MTSLGFVLVCLVAAPPAAREPAPTRLASVETAPSSRALVDEASDDTTPGDTTPDDTTPRETVVEETAAPEAVSTQAPPADSARPQTPPPATRPPAPRLLDGLEPVARGEATLRLVDHHAKEARRERLVSGSIGLGAASLQIALGVVGRVELGDEGTAMRRSAISQMAVGSIGIVNAVSQLAIRSPLERMRRSPTYAALEANPGDVTLSEALRSDWEVVAKNGRRRRFVFGGIGLGVGALLTTVASVRLADSDTTSGEQIWAYTTLGTAIGVLFGGIAAMALPSESERSFAAIEAAQPRRKPQVRVSPSIGGMAVQGRF